MRVPLIELLTIILFLLKHANEAGSMPGDKLEFQKQEPAFLRRLREEHGGPRNNVQIARPKKDRLRSGEDGEDDPVIVDEAGDDVAKEEWEERLRREKDGTADTVEDGQIAGGEGVAKLDGEATRDKQKPAEIGAVKKRKVGRVIADDGVDQEPNKGDEPPSGSKKENGAAKATGKDDKAKPKKKAKKIKLSFDDPE